MLCFRCKFKHKSSQNPYIEEAACQETTTAKLCGGIRLIMNRRSAFWGGVAVLLLRIAHLEPINTNSLAVASKPKSIGLLFKSLASLNDEYNTF